MAQGDARPRLSVAMPAYNAAEYVGEAIESILNQTFGDFELIVVDDGSTDKTADVVAGHAHRDPRVLLHRTPHAGVVRAGNTAISLASGDLVARHDADDISLPQRFALQVAFLDAHPEVGLVGTWSEFFGSASYMRRYPAEHGAIRSALLLHAFGILNSTVMMRREVWQRTGGYRPHFPVSEDIDFFLRVSEIAHIANIPQPLHLYRRYAASSTARARDLIQDYSALARECARQREAFGRDVFMYPYGGVERETTPGKIPVTGTP